MFRARVCIPDHRVRRAWPLPRRGHEAVRMFVEVNARRHAARAELVVPAIEQQEVHRRSSARRRGRPVIAISG